MTPQNTPLYLVKTRDDGTKAVHMVVGWTDTGAGTHMPVTVMLDSPMADIGYAAWELARFADIPDPKTVHYTTDLPGQQQEEKQSDDLEQRLTEQFLTQMIDGAFGQNQRTGPKRRNR